MHTRRLSTLTAVLCLALVASATAQVAEDEKIDNRFIRWETHREATDRSRVENKPMLIYFTARWSEYGEKMDRETYGDIRVKRYLNENFTMTTVDIEKLPAMAKKYGVAGPPALWFLDARGRKLTNVPGFISPERLLPLLEFIATGAYETREYQDWLDERK